MTESDERRILIQQILSNCDPLLQGQCGLFFSEEIEEMLSLLDDNLGTSLETALYQAVRRLYRSAVDAKAKESNLLLTIQINDNYFNLIFVLYVRFKPTYGIADFRVLEQVSKETYDRLKIEYKNRHHGDPLPDINIYSDERMREGFEEMCSLLLYPPKN